MSWWDSGFSNFANQATQALQKAQQQIDKVLDIKEETEGQGAKPLPKEASGRDLNCSPFYGGKPKIQLSWLCCDGVLQCIILDTLCLKKINGTLGLLAFAEQTLSFVLKCYDCRTFSLFHLTPSPNNIVASS